MGFSYSTLKNLSNEYQDYPPGCVPCPEGYVPGNPGTFEEIHKKFDVLEPKHFEGVRLVCQKNHSKHFFVTHKLAMCPKVPWIDQIKEEQGYKFGVSYTGTKRVGPVERYPKLSGEMRTNGDLTANFVHTLGCRCRVKLAAKIKNSVYEDLRSSIEYRTDDFTVSATLVNPVILKRQGVLVLQYLQSIHPRITLGVEVACNQNASSPAGKQAHVAWALRYSTGFRTLSGTFSKAGARVCYHHRESRHLQMGVEFQTNYITRESKSRLVYQVDAPKADLVFKGFVDTNWRLGAVLEKKLYPIPEGTLVLSGILDHVNQNVSVGVGLNIGV